MASEEDELIIEVLPEEEFKKSHLPDAISVPLENDFDERIKIAVPDKTRMIIVYCKNENCDASAKAAERMEALGYENVYHYAAGKEDWRDAELPMIEMPDQQ